MFRFLKKNKSPKSELDMRLETMKLRKLSYVDTDFSEFISLMNKDVKNWLKLKPVNYYAIKREYIMGSVYTNEDHSENYVSFERYEQERRTDKSAVYPVDYELLSKALAKVGIIITRPDAQG